MRPLLLHPVLIGNGCGLPGLSRPSQLLVDVEIHPAGVFHVYNGSPCHNVLPDGAFLRWDVAAGLTGGRGGRLDSITTTFRDGSSGEVVQDYHLGAELIVQKVGTSRLTPTTRLRLSLSTVIGTCVPIDYTRRGFSLTVVAHATDDRGETFVTEVGPLHAGPAR